MREQCVFCIDEIKKAAVLFEEKKKKREETACLAEMHHEQLEKERQLRLEDEDEE